MAATHDVSEEWQLLEDVLPIFSSKLPMIDLSGRSESVQEVLLNFETLFEFEIWLVPDVLQEAQALAIHKNLSHEGVTTLRSLLQFFEECVDVLVLQFHWERQKSFPKLRALQYELKQRHGDHSGKLQDHARGLGYLVWVGLTLEGFRDIINCLGYFNRTVNRVSSSAMDDDSSQDTKSTWKAEDVQSILEAERTRQNLNMTFDMLTRELRDCNPPHTAMVHLTSLQSIKLLLSSCSNQRSWRQTVCEVVLDKKGIVLDLSLRGATQVENLCAIIRGPRHKLLQLICSDSELWHSSQQTVPIVMGQSRITLLKLLESRAHDRTDLHHAPFLSKRKKKIVAVMLAGALMKVLGSRWIQKEWSAENIFFLTDTSTGAVTDISVPYIMCCMTSESSDGDEKEDFKSYYQSIYSFGILLLELELDQRISVTAGDEEDADEESPPVYLALGRVLQLRKEDLDDAYVREVINSCLDFGNRVESITHPSFTSDLKFRAAILRYIVKPLVKRLQAAYSEVSLDVLGVSPLPIIVRPLPIDASHNDPCSPTVFAPRAATTYRSQKVFSVIETANLSQRDKLSHLAPKSNSIQPRHRRDFKIAIICALPLEADAVKGVFDQRWDDYGDVYGKAPRDQNAYSTGVIGRHNVVLAHMPGMGKESAASVAAYCRSSFEGIQLALVVGICGGVPMTRQSEEILLGDVIVSEGIIPYDFGRQLPDRFERKNALLDNLGRPNAEIRALLAKLKGKLDRQNLEAKVAKYLTVLQRQLGGTAIYPGPSQDKLYPSRYRHKHRGLSGCNLCEACINKTDPTCEEALDLTCEQLKCDEKELVRRNRLDKSRADGPTNERSLHEPKVHFGLVASGSIVMKSGEDREHIAAKDNVIAFEMEGAGVWDTFPCLVIKGVCDYADSHKSKRWQNYAAASAAACMKAFLENWATRSSGF